MAIPGRPSRARPDVLAVIAAGGAVGASARYGIATAIPAAPGEFPWATWWINASGSLLLGLLLALILERFPPTRYARPFFGTGVLGGFTTFSTLAVEADLLVKNGHGATAALYLAASVVAGLVAVGAGLALGRRLPIRSAARRSHRYQEEP